MSGPPLKHSLFSLEDSWNCLKETNHRAVFLSYSALEKLKLCCALRGLEQAVLCSYGIMPTPALHREWQSREQWAPEYRDTVENSVTCKILQQRVRKCFSWTLYFYTNCSYKLFQIRWSWPRQWISTIMRCPYMSGCARGSKPWVREEPPSSTQPVSDLNTNRNTSKTLCGGCPPIPSELLWILPRHCYFSRPDGTWCSIGNIPLSNCATGGRCMCYVEYTIQVMLAHSQTPH